MKESQVVTEADVQAALDIILSDVKAYSKSLNYAVNYVRAAKGLTGHALFVQTLYILSNLAGWRHPKAKEVRQILRAFKDTKNTIFSS